MDFSIRDRILAWLAPDHRLRCRRSLWNRLLAELARRGSGERESGAFLLGRLWGERREISAVAYYDDLAPDALASGGIRIPGSVYGVLWRVCREQRMRVVGDVHTHPGVARQSGADREHPMLAERGHVALIVPFLAIRPFKPAELGVYQYLGGHQWRDQSGNSAERFFLRTTV
jgi:proteasome lid subunit RPN8/RPN11